jgi:bidirectional [NiFe] hydrogenase diaphorase subunit
MPATETTPAAQAAGDVRYKIVDATIRRHRYEPGSLIEVLHTAQERFGYLDHDILLHVARALSLPTSRVYGV